MFKTIALLIALLTFTKATTALFMPARFYRWRSRQYGSEAVPRILLLLPFLFLILAGASWYATFFEPRPYGWVVTSFTTLIATVGLLNLSRWSTHRQKTAATINTQPATRTRGDIIILLVGLLFGWLALFVY